MIKKVSAYQRILDYSISRCNQKGKSSEGIIFDIFLFIYFFFMGSGISAHKSSIWIGPFLVIGWMVATIIQNHSSRMLRMLPVSDEFAVANMMFLFPVKIAGLAAIGIFVVLSILQILIEGNFTWIFGINIAGCLFSVMIAAGIWFWWCLGAFHKNVVKRRIWYIAVFVVYEGGIFILSEVMQHRKIYVDFAFSDLLDVFPPVLTLIAGAAFAGVSGIIAWRGSLKLYRADIKGQEKSKDIQDNIDERCNRYVKSTLSKKGKRQRNIAVVMLILPMLAGILAIISICMALLGSGDGKKVNIITSDPADYKNWNSYRREIDIDEDLWTTGEIIFPENMKEEYIDEYYVKIDGEFQKYEWASISKLRFLAVTLPKEEYQKEKERLADISVSCYDEEVENDTNYVLHDTENFETEAYIAVYETGLKYEYALTDDEKNRIVYLFAESATPQEVPTDIDFSAKAFANVIPITQANTNGKGFSIYSFRDKVFHLWYEVSEF